MLTDTSTLVAKRIRMARAEANLTQEDLGKKASLSSHVIFNLETGRKKITVDHLAAVATAVNKPIPWFFADMADYLPPIDTRTLRTKNRDLPPEAIKELVNFVLWINEKYGEKQS